MNHGVVAHRARAILASVVVAVVIVQRASFSGVSSRSRMPARKRAASAP
jgi:hypothetical protein